MFSSSSVFVPNPSAVKPGYDVATALGRSRTDGEIGIEIECEGNKFPKGGGPHGNGEPVPSMWAYHHDGSLRGVDNAEYVLKKPIKFSEVPSAVTKLYERLAAYGTVLSESNRTSVHVHLNVQSFYLPRLTTFLALYFSIEEILTEWCGDHRVGNLFCLRAKDAPAIVHKIKEFIKNDYKANLSEGLHYSGMNAQALVKFGSLEIRSLRGVSDPKTIIDWVGVLERLYRHSAEYTDPRNVTEDFSGNDPIEYLKRILGSSYDVVRNGIEMSDDDIRASMYEGIRLAQDLCYCRDWSQFKEADVSKDPFGRNSKSSDGLAAAFEAHAAQLHTAQLHQNYTNPWNIPIENTGSIYYSPTIPATSAPAPVYSFENLTHEQILDLNPEHMTPEQQDVFFDLLDAQTDDSDEDL